MILADTDVITILQIGRGPEHQRISRHMLANRPLALNASIISYEEQMRGSLAFINRSNAAGGEVNAYARLMQLIEFYGSRDILPFDAAAAVAFQGLKSARIRVGTMDLRIAAIALSRDVPLATRNVRDFERIPGLRLLDWSK